MTNIKYPPKTGTTYLPCNELQERVKAMQEITDLKEKLEYYNKHICSLVAYISTTDGLQSFGMAGNSGQGYGSPVFDFNPESKQIYLQVREKEIKRLQKLLNKAKGYREQLTIFFRQKAGQKDFTALKVFSNQRLEFLLNGGGTVPDNMQWYAINLEPQDKEQIATLNQYQKAYYLESLSDHKKANWLIVDAYNGFKFQPTDTFQVQLNKAFDRTAAINDKIKEIENSGLINDLKNGIEPDLSQGILSSDAVKLQIHKGQLFLFYKELKRLEEEQANAKSNHETQTLNTVFFSDAIEPFLTVEQRLVTDGFLNADYTLKGQKKALIALIYILKERNYLKPVVGKAKHLYFIQYRIFFESRYKTDLRGMAKPSKFNPQTDVKENEHIFFFIERL